MRRPLPITVVSDVVCPWCFIGKRRLEKAIALRPQYDVQVRWHPFFLNDWVPREGMGRADYLTAKFGSVERYRQMAERIKDAAAAEGLDYQLDKIARQPNTLDCHRLIFWAGREQRAAEMNQRLMDLYFTEGADLTDREVLVGAAAACGLDLETIRNALAGEADVALVAHAAEQARREGIDGVPCFIMGNVLAVAGAQVAEYLASAMDRAVAEMERLGNSTTRPATP